VDTKTNASSGPGMFRRLLGFGGLPFLSMATPFLFLPILARVGGPDAWVAIAVGQSAGSFAALFVGQGFNLVGPTLVNTVPLSERTQLFRQSIQSRALLFFPGAAVAALIAFFVAPDGYRHIAALMSIAMTLTGLSSAWYMIGLGRAGLIAMYEILPKLVATIVAATLVVVFSEVIWYPLALMLASVTSLVVFSAKSMSLRSLFKFNFVDIRRSYREHRSVLATEVAGGAYVALTVTFVALCTVPLQAAAYVTGDKLYRLGLYAVSSVGNALQGWVVEDNAAHFSQRARKSLLVHSIVGVFGLATFVIAGPWLSELLFGAEVAIDRVTALGFGAATLAIALNTSLGRNILIGLGARKAVMTSVFIGAGIGVPAVLVLSALYGAAGGAWGLAISELTVALVQAVVLLARRRRLRPNTGAGQQGPTREDVI